MMPQPILIGARRKVVVPAFPSDWLPSELMKGTIMTILTFSCFFDKNENEVGGFGL